MTAFSQYLYISICVIKQGILVLCGNVVTHRPAELCLEPIQEYRERPRVTAEVRPSTHSTQKEQGVLREPKLTIYIQDPGQTI